MLQPSMNMSDFEAGLSSCKPELGARKNGEGGIRTHGRRKPSEVFKTSAFDHSATSPMIEDQAEILSAPPIQGRRASGMTMLPSGCW